MVWGKVFDDVVACTFTLGSRAGCKVRHRVFPMVGNWIRFSLVFSPHSPRTYVIHVSISARACHAPCLGHFESVSAAPIFQGILSMFTAQSVKPSTYPLISPHVSEAMKVADTPNSSSILSHHSLQIPLLLCCLPLPTHARTPTATSRPSSARPPIPPRNRTVAGHMPPAPPCP